MVWSHEDLMLLSPEEFEYIIGEILQRLGFKNVQVVGGSYDKGIDIIGYKDDPIVGIESYVVQVKRKSKGKIGYTELERFLRVVNKASANRGIFVTSTDFTRDAYEFARNTGGRIILWNYIRVLEYLNEYEIPKPSRILNYRSSLSTTTTKELSQEKDEVKLKLRSFTLSTPLLFEFEPYEIAEIGKEYISKKFGVPKKDTIKPKSIIVTLSSGYIIDWKVYYMGLDSAGRFRTLVDENRALVFHDGNVKLFGNDDLFMKSSMSNAMRKSRSTFEATDKQLLRGINMSESIMLVKSMLNKRYKEITNITITNKKCVYIPLFSTVEYAVGKNIGRIKVDLFSKEIISADLTPLSTKDIKEIAKSECARILGEVPGTMNVKQGQNSSAVTGETQKFFFDIKISPITGEVLEMNFELKDDVILQIVGDAYPKGQILHLERKERVALVDVLAETSVIVLSVDLHNGTVTVLKELKHPNTIAKLAQEFISKKYNLQNLKVQKVKLQDHSRWQVWLSGKDGYCEIEIDETTGEINANNVRISRTKAIEILQKSAPLLSVKELSETQEGYVARGENETELLTLRISFDGRDIGLLDKWIKPNLASKIALRAVLKNYPLLRISPATTSRKDQDWEVHLKGEDGTAKVVVDKTGHEVTVESVIISPKRAKELMTMHFSDFKVSSLTRDDIAYNAVLENETWVKEVKLSLDGTVIEEIDEYLQESVAITKAKAYLTEKGFAPKVLDSRLSENWIINFKDMDHEGYIVLDKRSGSVILEKIRLTRDYLIKVFLNFIQDPDVELIDFKSYKEKEYATVKAFNPRTKMRYYGKLHLETGEILDFDKLEDKGIISKFKKIKLENKYG